MEPSPLFLQLGLLFLQAIHENALNFGQTSLGV
jgi:hypothetical protein